MLSTLHGFWNLDDCDFERKMFNGIPLLFIGVFLPTQMYRQVTLNGGGGCKVRERVTQPDSPAICKDTLTRVSCQTTGQKQTNQDPKHFKI